MKSSAGRGLERRYGPDVPQANKDRLSYEIGVIKTMGYTNYYLIVWDYVNYAKSQGIPVGPGRGSGAGSIAAYSVGITDIDPIRYNLIFERFLNPERVSMPDFDVDFCYERRQEVIDYVNRKYGADHVAQIVTFGTMAARNAIRDVGRVLGMPYQSVDVVAKQVPMELKNDAEARVGSLPGAQADVRYRPAGNGAHRYCLEGGGNAPPCLYPCGRCCHHPGADRLLSASGDQRRPACDPVQYDGN